MLAVLPLTQARALLAFIAARAQLAGHQHSQDRLRRAAAQL